MQKSNYQFTEKWFEYTAKNIWDVLIPKINPTCILEIGSYEGASACYLIEKLAASQSIELHCIDTWEGGVEHKEGGSAQADMSAVEERFLHNTKTAIEQASHSVSLTIHKGFSDIELSKLVANGKQGYFDLIYIDGSHQAPDVLCDAVLSFKLLKKNGYMVFDDYLWQGSIPQQTNPIDCPKLAIDAFTNIYSQKIRILSAPLYQLYIQKIEQ